MLHYIGANVQEFFPPELTLFIVHLKYIHW